MAVSWSPLGSIEDDFNHTSAKLLMVSIWPYSILISLFYVVSIFTLQKYMEHRPRFNLRGPLMVWSLVLALFSGYGFCVTGLHHWSYGLKHGWKRSVCDSLLLEKQFGLWGFLFCFSKCPELVDTYFIILRKQKLIFLHWYHHITVFIYCWHAYAHLNNPQQWFITMNYFVHSIMYFYYALRASRVYRPPVFVNMIITSLQILQMVVGVGVNVYLYYNMKMTPGWHCDDKIEGFSLIYLAFVMYFSYFILFAQFFYSSYVNKGKETRSAKLLKNENRQANENGVSAMRNGSLSHNAQSSHSMNSSTDTTIRDGTDSDHLIRDGLHLRK